MEVTEIENSVKQLLEFWGKQKILSPPNKLDDILYFEFSKILQLPDDFRRLYMMSNGMVNLFPNYFDNEGFLFYPLQELTTLQEEFDIETDNTGEHCLIFAEFMHKSWWYGVRFSKIVDNYEIGIIASVNRFKVITRNLTEFIRLYMNDSPVLYDYE